LRVLVDTSVWSLALRRREPNDPGALELLRLLDEERASLIGPVRQELLSGIRERSQFEALRDRLSSFPDLDLETMDFERAAEFYNLCRSRGIQGSNTDFLICAVAERHGLSIFSTDLDFQDFALHLPITLYSPRNLN
jgi:predicted nucleic acid-binding protein